MARYWVAGATGFLGAHLVEHLLARGHDVVAVARGEGSVHGVPVTTLDILDEDTVKRSAAGCDGGFVAAGKVSRNRDDAEELHRLHVFGTRSALSGLRAAGVRRAVYVSTSGTIAVGESKNEAYDESHPAPLEIIARFPYYRSKRYAELEALEANSPEFEVVVVNPTLLLGPGDVRGSSTEDVRRYLERSIPATPSGGLSFVDVRDAAAATFAAFERGRAGERYLLSAINLTVAAFFERLHRSTGVAPPALRMPRSRAVSMASTKMFSKLLRAIGGEPPVDEVSVEMAQYFWYCNCQKAERELGFSPRDPAETLSDTVEWILSRDPTLLERTARVVGRTSPEAPFAYIGEAQND